MDKHYVKLTSFKCQSIKVQNYLKFANVADDINHHFKISNINEEFSNAIYIWYIFTLTKLYDDEDIGRR